RTGNSMLSVNLPHCHLEYEPGSHRLMHIHHNVPGILRAINDILADRGINIERQVLDTRGTLGYAIYDINRPCDGELMRLLRAVPHTIGVRAAGGQALTLTVVIPSRPELPEATRTSEEPAFPDRARRLHARLERKTCSHHRRRQRHRRG